MFHQKRSKCWDTTDDVEFFFYLIERKRAKRTDERRGFVVHICVHNTGETHTKSKFTLVGTLRRNNSDKFVRRAPATDDSVSL